MSEVARYALDGGGSVLVEVDEDTYGVEPTSATDAVIESGKRLVDALGTVRQVAQDAIEAVRDLDVDEVALELGVKFAAEKGVIVAKASAEAAITVTVKWTPDSAV